MAPNERFNELLHDIEPSSTTVAHCKSAHEAMREFLRDHHVFGERHVDTFLSGSYKRDTAIRPSTKEGAILRPDVDIIVLTNHTQNESPSAVVNQLHDAIAEGYDTIRKQARSVGITTSNVDMDVVPIIDPTGSGSSYLIPDRQLKRWLPTNPPGHTQWTTNINKKAQGRFKPLVKIAKWWRRVNPTSAKQPKGFVIECLVAECMDYQENHYGLLFVKTLEAMVARYGTWLSAGIVPEVPDPGVAGNNVTSSIAVADFASMLELAAKHAKIGRRALEGEDLEEITQMWRTIFGPRFPSSRLAKSDDLLSAPAAPSTLAFPNRPVHPNKPAGFA